ncbi:hypothetical protein [Campylobacter concisus]|uniref:hypothetical protein n=1 Tax=Campylobacter concisus TaxID=199 RepID=UPI000CD9B540|nr:hypothetical protein [Campylobacter concisus]
MKKIMLATALLLSSLFGAEADKTSEWKIEPLTNPYFMASEDMKEDITAYCSNYVYRSSDFGGYTPILKLTFTALTYPDSKLANKYLPKDMIDYMKNKYVALEGNITEPNERFSKAAAEGINYFIGLDKDASDDLALKFYNDANRACNAKYYKKDIGIYRPIDKETLIKGQVSVEDASCPKEGASIENYTAPFVTLLGVVARQPRHSAASFFDSAVLYRIKKDYARNCYYNLKISKDVCMDEVLATALPDIINYYNRKEKDGFFKSSINIYNDVAKYCNEKLKTEKYKTITLEEMKRVEAEGEAK